MASAHPNKPLELYRFSGANPRILIRGLNWLGDAIMGTAALQRLRETYPGANISMLCHSKLADLWRNQPFVDEVIAFNKGQSLWVTSKMLRSRQFDFGIIFPNSIRSALEFWLGRVPVRIGYERPWRTMFLSHPVPHREGSIPMHKRDDAEVRALIQSNPPRSVIPPSAHHVHDYLRLVAAVGASPDTLPPRIHVTDAEMAEVRKQFRIGSDDTPWFGLNPGAEYGPAKRWPAESFIKAAVELNRITRCRWILFGGPSDVATTEQIAREVDRQTGAGTSINLAGKTSLRQLAAAFKQCALVLTNDTGPMHLASAVGVPVIVPFGSTSPEMTGPVFAPNAWVVKSTVPCSPCFRRQCPIDLRCLNGITPDQVVKAALECCPK